MGKSYERGHLVGKIKASVIREIRIEEQKHGGHVEDKNLKDWEKGKGYEV